MPSVRARAAEKQEAATAPHAKRRGGKGRGRGSEGRRLVSLKVRNIYEAPHIGAVYAPPLKGDQ